jgi:hypothetical protein
MITRIRRLPSPALIVASIALVFAIAGGIGYAASKISGSRLKDHSVAGKKLKGHTIGAGKLKDHTLTGRQMKSKSIPGGKLKPDTVTGKQVKESTLGKVPSAAQADNATNATNATNANHATSADNATNANNAMTVGGITVRKFSLIGNSPLGNQVILEVDGLQILASCTGGDVTTAARTSVNDGEISAVSRDASSATDAQNFDDTFNVGDTFTLPQFSHSDEVGQGRYIGGDGRFVHFTYTEEDSNNQGGCLLHGFAFGS